MILFNNTLFDNIGVILISSLILFFFLKYLFEDPLNNKKNAKEKSKVCGNCKSLIEGNCIELKTSITKHEKACFMFDKKVFSTEQEKNE
jgi:hypothetical protein